MNAGRVAIPFNVPYVAGRELEYVAAAAKLGHLSGDGPFTKRATAELLRIMSSPRALLTTSCTHALEMAALLLDLEPGDEVIMPSFTFVSTANAFVLRGAVPVFVDIRADTLNIDERLVESAITDRTRVVVVVHYAGIGCHMTSLCRLTTEHGVALVEDNAHGLGASYRGRVLGTFGNLATQSFHETKNVHCGEGGALVVNDESLFERAEVIREKGTNRSQYFRGMVDKYTWIDIGSSFLPSDLLAAFLLGQLESFDSIQAERHRVWSAYATELASWAAENDVRTSVVPDEVQHPAHLFYLLLPNLHSRQAFIEHMKSRGVGAVFHYVPLHNSPQGMLAGRSADGCPVTISVSERIVRLPLYSGLSNSNCERVLEAVTSFHAS